MFLFGGWLQRVFIIKILGPPAANQILLTIGLGLILSNTAMLIYSSDYQIITTSYSSSSIKFWGISLSQPLLISFIITCVIAGFLYWFLAKTNLGQAIRAT